MKPQEDAAREKLGYAWEPSAGISQHYPGSDSGGAETLLG